MRQEKFTVGGKNVKHSLHIHKHTCVCVCVYIYVCVCVCMHVGIPTSFLLSHLRLALAIQPVWSLVDF